MNDAKSMLMMYSYTAMKAATENQQEDKDTTKVKAETKTKAAKDNKQTKLGGKKNDEGTERTDNTVTKE